jgi:aspartyl-tRNA(Asn)/glutamyl-tRNA(Gln) amidotransferase subunit C
MSALKIDDVKHVAKLAKLDLTEEEIKKFHQELSKVVDYFSELNEIDTSDVEPTSQTTGLTDVLREDQINSVDILPQKSALSEANEEYNNFFVVPKILKHK